MMNSAANQGKDSKSPSSSNSEAEQDSTMGPQTEEVTLYSNKTQGT